MELQELIEVHFTDGTIKECYIESIERYRGVEGKIKEVYVEQRKYTAKEVKRFRG